MDKQVKFYEKGTGHTTFFSKEGISFRLSKKNKQKSQLIKLFPLNANKSPEVIAEGLQKGKVNYFSGNDPKA